MLYICFALFVKFGYFHNDAIDHLLLSIINLRFSSFIYSLPLFILVSTLLFYHLNEKSTLDIIYVLTISLLTFTNKIVYGFIIFLHTNDLFNPAESTFKWASYHEYNLYFEQYSSFPTYIINALLLASVIYWVSVNENFSFLKWLRKKK